MKKNVLALFMILCLITVSASIQAQEEVNSDDSSSNDSDVDLPITYFTPSSGENVEASTGPDGPPAPINDWIPVLLIGGVALAYRFIQRNKEAKA